MGVFPTSSLTTTTSSRLPHARGGVSDIVFALTCFVKSSPRSWGCFYLSTHRPPVVHVFPTLVGVFPISGGSSELRHQSSPRSWGCFRKGLERSYWGSVFPTLVGVFPDLTKLDVTKLGLPHARGGVSASAHESIISMKSSPRSWGCFQTGGI